MAFLCTYCKKHPDPNDLAVGITYFAYVAEPVANNEDSKYHEPKRIGDRVHDAAMAWYHLKALLLDSL